MNAQGFDYEINLRRYLRLLRDKKWNLVLTALLSFSAITIYFAIRGPVHLARVNLLVEEYESRPNYFQEFQHTKKEIKTRLLLIQGEQVLEEVIGKLGLTEKFKAASSQEAIHTLKKKINAYEEEFRSNVITIEVKDRDPQLAALMANTLADTYIQKDFEETYFVPKKIIDWLSKSQGDPGTDPSLPDSLPEGSIELLPSIQRDPLISDLQSRRVATELKIQQLEKEFRFPPTEPLKNELGQIDNLIEARKHEILQNLYLAVKEGFLPPTLRVVNYAYPPERPSRSEQIKVTVLGVYFSLIGVFGILVLQESLQRTLRTEEDLGSNFFLGYVPKEEEKRMIFPFSPAMRLAVQMIRASFLFCIAPGDEKCFLVTSPSATEGKSTLASALGISMAQQGIRTVLLDCDFQRSGFVSFWKIPAQAPTLSDFLSGQCDEAELGVQTEIENLEVIPAVSHPVKSFELLNHTKMEALIRELKARYDQVLIDAPPLLGVPETLFLCKLVHGVILVTRYHETKVAAFDHTLQKLKNMGIVLKGTIINAFDAAREKSHYYSKYYVAPSSCDTTLEVNR